uniref:Annexin D4-like n=1 Tax=Cucumis melo TaxID=3656 RepID=A0A9I9D389_CUCME
MSLRAAYDAFEQSLTGVGVDESGILKTITDESKMVDMYANFDADEYRLMSSNFKNDQSHGYIWKEKKRQSMKLEFQRVMNVLMLWMTSPLERDARLLRSAIKMGNDAGISVLIEIACTRSFTDILEIRHLYEQFYKSDFMLDMSENVPAKAVLSLVNLFSGERRQAIVDGEDILLYKHILAFQNSISEEPHVPIERIANMLSVCSIGHLRNIYQFCQPDMTHQILFDSMDSLPTLVTDTDHEDEDSICIEEYHDEASLHCLDSISRIIITRRGIDLDEINKKFIVSNELSLQERIKLYCKGTYQQLLLKLSLDVNILGSEAESRQLDEFRKASGTVEWLRFVAQFKVLGGPSEVVPTEARSDAQPEFVGAEEHGEVRVAEEEA